MGYVFVLFTLTPTLSLKGVERELDYFASRFAGAPSDEPLRGFPLSRE